MAYSRGKILATLFISFSVLAIVGFFVTILLFAQPLKVQGKAMEPNLNEGDRIFVSRNIGELERGDVVTFYYPKDQSKMFIQRIVCLPGETIEFRDGKVSIDGKYIEESYLNPQFNSALLNREPVKIPEQSYYVLGDNRDHSNDSRFWGALPKNFIYGKFIGRYWPIG